MPANLDVKTQGQTVLKVWEVTTAIACLYVARVIPFTLGFEKMYIVDDASQCLFDRQTHNFSLFAIVCVLDIFIDVIFWVDIVINFVTARWELQKEPMLHWELIDNMDEISSLYIREIFSIDVAGSFPVQYFDCIKGMTANFIKAFRLIRLSKLFRLYRIKNMILALQAKYPESVFVVTGMQMFYCFLGANWCACIFFSITYGLGDPHSDDPYVRHLLNDGWARSDGFLDENGKHVQYTADPWLSSMYWAVTPMSTIVYGEIMFYCS